LLLLKVFVALNECLLCADVLLRNYSLTHRDDDPTALHLCPSTAAWMHTGT